VQVTVVDELMTARLVLRAWRPEDREPFAALNADPEVMAHFPAPLGRDESDTFASRISAALAEQGWGLWAVALGADGPFIGFVGLQWVPFEAAFTPAVEIGWRLARPHWGQGYATEAGRAALHYAFGRLGLDSVVSFTATSNAQSQAVMVRLEMTGSASSTTPAWRRATACAATSSTSGAGPDPVRRARQRSEADSVQVEDPIVAPEPF
jgi:RimJ/RimL family protein N-acetyltransferase